GLIDCPDRIHEVRFGANVRINALSVWHIFQAAMPSQPRLDATSTAKSISGAMTTPQRHLPLLPACQRRRPMSPWRVPRAQLAGMINHPAQQVTAGAASPVARKVTPRIAHPLE